MTVNQFIKEVEREQGPLRRFLRTLCRGDGQKADDIAQEALLKAYLHINNFNGRSKFSTWLYRIAFNTFSDWTTSVANNERCKVSIESIEAMRVISEESSIKDYELLYKAIDGLSPKKKVCVLLFYMEDRSIVEIAAITGMPVGTVKSHLSRAREHLKITLKTLEELK